MKQLTSIALTSLVSLVGCGDNEQPKPTMDDDELAATFPISCLDVKNGLDIPNGEYTLYAYGDEKRPWKAICHDMNEYLAVDATQNFGSFAAGGLAVGTTVRTEYSRLRIDPETFKVDITDRTFATTTGSLVGWGVAPITSMPLGVAYACDGYNTFASARINLAGTPFVIDQAYAVEGQAADGSETLDETAQRLSLNAAGDCGWHAPAGVVSPPYNDELGDDSWVLRLAYGKAI